MKKIFILAAAAMVTLASCIKEADTPAVPEGLDAYLTFQFDVESTKATTGNHDADQDQVLDDLTIFVLNSADEIIKTAYLDNTTNWGDFKLPVTTSAKKLVGIGNIGSDKLATEFADMVPNNLATLSAKMTKLENVGGTAKVMMGAISGPIPTFTKNAQDKYESTATLTLNVIPARIDVTITDNRDNLDAVGAHLLKEAVVLYSGAYTHYVANSTTGFVPVSGAVSAAGGKYFYLGDYYSWAGASTNHETYAPLKEAFTTPTKRDVHKKTFYVLPGGYGTNGAASVDAKNLIVSLVSETNDAAKKITYWPVHFNMDDVTKMYVQNGRWYKLNITLSGNATSGGGTDPEKPEVDGTLKVTVGMAGWIEIQNPIEKNFHKD